MAVPRRWRSLGFRADQQPRMNPRICFVKPWNQAVSKQMNGCIEGRPIPPASQRFTEGRSRPLGVWARGIVCLQYPATISPAPYVPIALQVESAMLFVTKPAWPSPKRQFPPLG